MSNSSVANQEHDEQLAAEVARALSALQLSIHAAVEAGLKVNATVESMHAVGEHHPVPLVEITIERVTKLI